MDESHNLKEDQKNMTETNFKKKSNSIDRIGYKNKLEYSKKIQNKNLINIQKFFLKEKYAMSQTKSSFPLYNLNSSKNKSIRLKDSSSYLCPQSHREDQTEKEKIIAQIFLIEDEINRKDEELDEYKYIYKHLQESNLTFKTIMERILNIRGDVDINNLGNIDNIVNKNNNKNFKKKKDKNKSEEKIINRLKREIIHYDKTIEEKEKILDVAKNKKNINNFININKLLNEKNRELENLVTGSQKLQYSQHEMEKKVDFYISSIKGFTEMQRKLQDKLEINEKEIKFTEKEIEECEKQINDYYDKIDKLEEEINKKEKNRIKKKEEIEKIFEEYNNNKKIEKEKDKINNDLENYNNKINYIKKVIDRNNRNIIRIKYENEELENDISILKSESNSLNGKTKNNNKNKNNLKYYEKEIALIKEELKKNKLKYENMIIKEEEDKAKIRKEIEEFEKAKKGLIDKINDLTKELREKTKENNIKEEELAKANEEYTNVMKDTKSNH